MDVTLIFVFCLIFLVSLLLFKRTNNLPPGYYGIPFIGSVSLMRKLQKDRPHLALYKESKRLGKIFHWYLGNQLVVVLSGYDIIHEALVKKADACSDRIISISNSLFPKFPAGRGILTGGYGEGWRQLRRFTLQALRDFGVGKASIEEKIHAEIEVVSTFLLERNGEPTSMNDLMQKVVANVIFGVVFGKRYDYDDREFDKARKMTNIVVSGSGPLNLSNFLPKFIVELIHKKDAENQQARRQSILDIYDYISKQIAEHEATFDANNIRDFVDIYIKTEKEGDESIRKFVTKGNMFRVIIDLFLAGSETTSTSLDWAFLFMTEFPDVQKKCQSEIEKVLGDKLIEYSDRNKLVYVNAVVMEIQRLSSIVPLNVIHFTSADTNIGGYDIPARTMLIPSLYSVSMDSTYFPNPEKFDPERFIDDSGNLIKNEALIPFSAGPRTCLGEPLARMELFLVFANLLQRFNFTREDPNKPHTLESKQAQITNAPVPYRLRTTKRQ